MLWGTGAEKYKKIFVQWEVKVARTYLHACCICFLFAFFRMNGSTDFYDFWHPFKISNALEL